MVMDFREDQIVRYSRQIILPEVGGKGQRKLLQSKMLVIGAGGLGSPAALYLAAAGVGTIGIADSDAIDLSNLQRQILHRTEGVGQAKTESAAHTLHGLNPDVKVVTHPVAVQAGNILDLIEPYDLVLDGTDNFPARFLVNDACVMKKKPLIHAGIDRFHGQAMTILPGEGPCYRCIFHEPPPPGTVPSCQEAGVMGSVAGVMGSLMATEAIKLTLSIGEPLAGRLLVFDALAMTFRNVPIERNADCAVCSSQPRMTELIDYPLHCGPETAGQP